MSNAVPPGRLPLRGAVDLAALAAAKEAQAAAEQRLAEAGDLPPGIVVDVTEETFQSEVLDRSFTVPVVIDLWADWCQPCKALTPVLEALAAEDAGAWVLAKVDVDAEQRIAAAFQVQSIPTTFAVVKGQPVPLFQGALPAAEVRQYLDELLRVAAANGVTGRVVVDGEPEEAVEEEPAGDPRFDAAYDAIEAGDWDTADAAYRAVLATAPNDPEATAGLAQVAILRRTEGVDPATVLAAADAAPDSLEAQSLAADLELLTGRVDEAFARIVDLVRRASGDDRTAARDHLLSLFALVGESDPRVTRARAALASALF
ncbi:MAG TPA: tetratricopeptide repeat protein [Candidatus Nanopelagicales bacterium]|nr:tetratricopeptide repeat protein [Candidatus Nanopelagicales bacterium]